MKKEIKINVVIGRSGEIKIIDPNKKIFDQNNIPYGAIL